MSAPGGSGLADMMDALVEDSQHLSNSAIAAEPAVVGHRLLVGRARGSSSGGKRKKKQKVAAQQGPVVVTIVNAGANGCPGQVGGTRTRPPQSMPACDAPSYNDKRIVLLHCCV